MLPRLCHIGRAGQAERARTALDRANSLGFSGVVAAAEPASWQAELHTLAEACASRDLDLLVDVDFSQWDLQAELVGAHPDCFAIRRESNGEIVDPRSPGCGHGNALLRSCDDLTPVTAWCEARLGEAVAAGVKGFRVVHPGGPSVPLWNALAGPVRARPNRGLVLIADTTGVPRSELLALGRCGFDFTLSSLPWWDGRANWLIEEHEALRRVAPVIAQVDSPAKLPPASLAARRARLLLAALTGCGIMMPLAFADALTDDSEESELLDCIRAVNGFVNSRQDASGALLKPTGAGAGVTVLMRVEGSDPTLAGEALVALVNPGDSVAAKPGWEAKLALGDFDALRPLLGTQAADAKLPPGEARLFHAVRMPAIRQALGENNTGAADAAKAARLVIANVSPNVAGRRFPARRIVGERVAVEADIYTDGHPVIAAELSWRADDDRDWHREPMVPRENDRWSAEFDLSRIGRYRFFIYAWIDTYGGFVRDLVRKRDAGHDIELDLLEGVALLRNRREHATGATRAALDRILEAFDDLPKDDRVGLLTAPETVETACRADERRFLTKSAVYSVEAERKAARFASWYELFPRSQTGDASRHGTFRDVIARLPAIADMGFDVLYLTPIHPVGRTHRKGRNNALEAGPDDPGSTYAIGSPEGGHEAIHPELGTLEDFRALVLAAHGHGMEIALDFAIQCSRDHPWLEEHKGWFVWRPDGSIHYAENPPKKYEDIVNIDFYAPEAVPAAWLALRDVVLHWIDAGVRILRVDNPHTKPFPFWEWMIADVRARHPNTIFLSEAFTRPKIMYRLAQLGFSQSYTYFIWRNTKREIMEYMTELTTPPVSDFFRPHFFVNTPDINPYFLQTSGRAGFLIRAALATTLSGLWGMYSGYELCESEPLPGREEYLNSEKYEIRPRDWNRPGNIIAEISALNRLRKSEPALQSHLGLAFYTAFNDQIVYYGKAAPGHSDRILVAVSLDAHHIQEADYEIPLWEWGLPDDRSLEAEDLLQGTRAVWRGKLQHLRLTPEAPYAIWRVRPAREQ
ncbi:MAG TPA: alpha-1,4-glucan--maltose-1-phosphate maltosyltransferase [Rhizomicrobium sp.]|jgi:starch synthase (maltosyl-transferring)|nr:alpha-1,4-glucan--maltose-1-phosphate maltosyltransferase [Rhizomicrobium sp.]